MPVGRARLERAGFDRFLVKPFGYAELAGAVRELARKRPEWHGAGRPFGSGASC
jgi:DNA-binding response OmpR family regulator